MSDPPGHLKTYRVLFAWALVFGFCEGRAHAHANAGVDAIDVVTNGRGALVGLESTVGYLRRLPAGGYDWLCHETVTQPGALITPRYAENADGTMLATVGVLDQAKHPSESLYWSKDGCEWMAPSGLTGHRVSAVSFDPHEPSAVVAVTATTGKTNGIHLSADAGRTWAEVVTLEPGWSFTSVVHATGRDMPIWAVSIETGSAEAALHRSFDGGASWTRTPITVDSSIEEAGTVRVLIADQTDSETAWLVAGPFLENSLLRTRDAGDTYTVVYRAMAEIIDGTQDADDGIWLVASGNKILHSVDGDAFQRLDHAPASLGVASAGNAVLLATRVPREGTALSVCNSAERCTPEPVLPTLRGPPSCPESSESARLCEPLWPDLSDAVFGTRDTGTPAADEADDTAGTEPHSSKGCCSSSGVVSTSAFLLMPFWWRRRLR